MCIRADAVGVRVLARNDAAASGAAHGTGRINRIKTNTLRCKAVDMRSLARRIGKQRRIPVGTDGRESVLVGHDQQYVGLVGHDILT